MKKTARGLVLVGVALLSLSVPLIGQGAGKPSVGSSSSSSTTPENPKPDDASTGATSVTVGFSEGDQTVTPVDPSNPNQQLKEHNGNIPGNGVQGKYANKGLALIFVTNELDFGNHPINAFSEGYYTAAPIKSVISTNPEDKPWRDNGNMIIEVSDPRGTDAGWHLRVNGQPLKWQSDDLKTNATEQSTDDFEEIKGASLEFPEGHVTSSGDINPETNDYQHTSRDATPIAVTKNDNLIGENGSAIILNAEQHHGMGMTVDAINPKNISLNIPANTAKKGVYTTTLTWNLINTPNS